MDGQSMRCFDDDDDVADSSNTILDIKVTAADGTMETNVGLQVSQEMHTTIIGDDDIERTDKDPITEVPNASNLVYSTSSIFDAEAQERMSAKDSAKWRTATFASTVLAVLGVVGLIAVLFVVIRGYLSGRYRPTVTDYGIVFDAGSTHTAMMLYGWNGEHKLNGTGTPSQLFKCIVDGDGISSYANGREKELSAAISECLQEGRDMIPSKQVASCPVFFGATAGMRLLNVQDPMTTRKLMDAVDLALSTSGFRYNSSMARILRGDEEGAGGWIQTNYLAKNLFGTDARNSVIGMLDLGGASTQFAAVVPEGLFVDFVPMNLYGNVYNVSVHSYLCFGRRQAQNRHRALLVLSLPVVFDGATVEDPCLPKGFNFTDSVKRIFQSPCTWSHVWDPRSSNVNPEITVTFVGTSSSSECSAQVRSQLNYTVCREMYNFTNCFEEHDLTAHKTPFIAMSGFNEVMMHLTDDEDSRPKYHDVILAVKNVCNSDWTRVKQLYWPLFERGVNIPSTVCYDATYAIGMLSTGYKFNEFTWDQLTFEDSIADADMGWAMGFLINETNWLPSQTAHFLPSSPFVYGLIALFATFLLASIAFAVLRLVRQCRKKPRKTYKKLPPTPPPHYGAI